MYFWFRLKQAIGYTAYQNERLVIFKEEPVDAGAAPRF